MKLENPLQVKPFKARRARLARDLGEGIVVLPTAPELHRNADTHYDYRWDSGFYYLTGFREPEAVLVMVLGAKPRSILFCREKNMEREIWDGFRYGPEAAREMFAFDESYPFGELDAAHAGADRQPGAAAHARGRGPGVGCARRGLAQCRARESAHRRDRTGADPRRARRRERHAPVQGRDRDRDHASRRRHLLRPRTCAP